MSNVLYYTVGNDLTHHGIKGQKWGQRNGPPYPLGASDHSSAEKKAGTKGWSKEAKQENKKTAAKENNSSEQITTKTKKNESVNTNAKKGLSTKQKVLIGATALVAAYAAYAFVNSGGATRLIQKGKMFVETGKTDGIPWKYNDKLASRSMDADEIFKNVVDPINPGFPKKGSVSNCMRCSFAYELRRRGYDVEATLSNGGVSSWQNPVTRYQAASTTENSFLDYGRKSVGKDDAIAETIKQTISMSPSGKTVWNGGKEVTHRLFDALAAKPNGARGELSVFRVGGSGHSLAWEIVDNKPIIFDCQKHTVYKTMSDFYSAEGYVLNEASITRLDDRELNIDFLLKWAKSAT